MGGDVPRDWNELRKTYKISDSGSPFGVSLPGAGKGSPIGIILPEAQTPFSIPVPQGTSIVVFFGRAEDSLDAIGVYVKSSRFLQSDDDAANVFLNVKR